MKYDTLGARKRLQTQSRSKIKRELQRTPWETLYADLESESADIDTRTGISARRPVRKLIYR